MKDWKIERAWDGQTCAVLASGESMSAAVAESIRIAGIHAIVVNNTWQFAPWADVLYAADEPWWKKYHADTKDFTGLKVCSDDARTRFPDVLQIKNSGKEGFDDNPAAIRTGGNSGYGAVHIAAHLGAKHILLCGFDMRGGHWHERHPPPLRDAGEGLFPKWIACFGRLAPELKKRGIEVINCTPGSALKCFPMADLSEVLAPCAIAA